MTVKLNLLSLNLKLSQVLLPLLTTLLLRDLLQLPSKLLVSLLLGILLSEREMGIIF